MDIDNQNKILVTGETDFSFFSDYLTLKLDQPIGIIPISIEVPKQFSLSQNYPNPFNPKTIINFDLPAGSLTTLKVYDVLGNELGQLVNEVLNAGSYRVEWDGSNYPSGVYFYKIESSDYTETRKMVLLK